jgi:hypothetical protein
LTRRTAHHTLCASLERPENIGIAHNFTKSSPPGMNFREPTQVNTGTLTRIGKNLYYLGRR